jgi:hypothetical protein
MAHANNECYFSGAFHSIRSAIAFVDELLALKDVFDDAPTTQFSLIKCSGFPCRLTLPSARFWMSASRSPEREFSLSNSLLGNPSLP